MRIPQAEWRIANSTAAAAAIMIKMAKKIPGFIDMSVSSRKARRRGPCRAPTLELFCRLSANALATDARLVDAATIQSRA
jgi:hypothetical protein